MHCVHCNHTYNCHHVNHSIAMFALCFGPRSSATVVARIVSLATTQHSCRARTHNITMAHDDEINIKGAAQEAEEPTVDDAPANPVEDQPADTAAESSVKSTEAEEEQSKDDQKAGEPKKQSPTDEELPIKKAKHRWFKCPADPTTYGADQYYYVHADTQESRWIEPEEPYWIYSVETGEADGTAGLQIPATTTKPTSEKKSGPVPPEEWEDWMGYNPKVHGNYDPNAAYAQVHNQKRAEEQAAIVDPFAPPPGTAAYESTMALNRFSGSVQNQELNPERHSDAAKSGRQMNAFFDVDAAANAHEGRSLKEERQSKKLSKEEVKAFNQARKEKKMKKRMAFYKS
ncbi:uncharacterized protein CLAFUR5_07419 [Fulvia fulva]|uniref:WW domain-containing protein n=1 Tax=Passalora fulva TaxID=5499 RepID=A0A9Q8PB69_PASFU|nr:uncharacterized protein CLAFUR5_07419 [Fulvia fulva]KAK4623427.1 hypothetical protein CLAFUR0_07295 [Fulvia fulva]UJO19278.1 hypothetical protein CLAFUR5_07419 [Fulvia fulva]WPV31238.1 hypothetical protein CLAFUW7_07291 [Fulvia fulva]